MKKHNLLYEPDRADCHAAAVRLKDQYPKEWENWLAFRMLFLTALETMEGSLKCHYCGADNLHKVTDGVQPQYQATIDHVKPLAKGGGKYDITNLVVACRPCNAKKADKDFI